MRELQLLPDIFRGPKSKFDTHTSIFIIFPILPLTSITWCKYSTVDQEDELASRLAEASSMLAEDISMGSS